MPRVPSVNGPEVQEQGINLQRNNIRASDETFGGGQSAAQASQAAQGLVQSAIKIEDQEIEKANQLAILEADQEMSSYETTLLYDRETGAMNKRGRDSFGLPDEVLPQYESRANEIAEGLANDAQKAKFRQMVMSRKKDINNQLHRHISKEGMRYDEQVTKSYIENERNAALKNFHDPERVSMALERQRAAVIQNAERNGLPKELLKERLKEVNSQTHAGIIEKFLNGGAVNEARDYYKKNKPDISGEYTSEIEKAMKVGVLQMESQAETDKIIEKNPDRMSDALEKARTIKDPDKRDEVVRRVKSRFAEMKQAKRQASDEAFETAYNTIDQNNGNIDSIPKRLWANMSASAKESIRKIADQKKNGLPVKTDIAAYYDLENLAGTPATRDKFMRMNLLEMKHKLSESDFKRFAKMQNEGRKGGSTKELDGIETKNSIVKSALAAGGVEAGRSASPEDIKKANLFKQKVDELVVQRQEATGKKVSNQELREITEGLMIETITEEGIFFDTKKRVFELTPQDSARVQLDDVPTAEVQKIKSTLQRLNLPVSDENILMLYSEKLNQFRGSNG